MTERTIFLLALEKPAGERSAFLDDACAGNAELRRQVEALLNEHDGAGSFLEEPAAAPTAAPSALDAPGSRIGPYKLLQHIGEGGFGMVYMAEQEQPVRRRVALKIIKPGMDSKQIVARFEAERQALAMMDHQNIARVYDAGTTPTGRPYFVMELVHGIPITKYCDDSHLSLRERLELFVPVCQAIQHAHQKGIIHRDIKPSNVLVTLYDGKPVAKVIDFGVAKAIEQRLSDRTMFTLYGTIVGTFEYMAPEQAEMSALGVDTRSDIYSLGVLLYELLTGSTPLERKKLRQAGLSEKVRMIKEDEPPRPSTRLSTSATLPALAAARKTEPSKLARLLRGELDWIVMKCLEKDRARRYETANGLARDLQRYLHDEPVEACPPSAGYKLRKLARKYKKAFAVGAAFALVLVLAAVVSALMAVRATLAEAEANKQRDATAKALAQAEAVSEFLTKDLLGQAAPEENARERKVTVEELLDKAARHIDSQSKFAEQPEVEAAIRLVIGNTLYKLGESKAAEPHLRLAVSLRRKALGLDHPDTLTAQEDLVWFLFGEGIGSLQENVALSKSTWEARSRVLGPDDPKTLESLDTYCAGLVRQLRYAEAGELHQRCYEARKRVLGEKHRDTLQTLANLGWDLTQQGQYAEAEPLLEKCLRLTIDVLGAKHPETLPVRNNLGLARMSLGKFAAALQIVDEGLSVGSEVHGAKSRQTLYLQHMRVRILFGIGKLEEAERLGRDTLAARREVLAPGQPQIGQTLVVLGLVLLAQGKAAEADTQLREAQDIFRGKTIENDWIVMAELGRAMVLLALGRFGEAEPPLTAAWPRFVAEKRIPAWHQRQVGEAIAKIYEQAGKPEEAAEWRKKVESVREAADNGWRTPRHGESGLAG